MIIIDLKTKQTQHKRKGVESFKIYNYKLNFYLSQTITQQTFIVHLIYHITILPLSYFYNNSYYTITHIIQAQKHLTVLLEDSCME